MLFFFQNFWGDFFWDFSKKKIVVLNFFIQFDHFRHNEDGSYSYGYEAADGSFKLETRYPDGRVKGKYGYVDIHTGELKVSSVFIKGQESINDVAHATLVFFP